MSLTKPSSLVNPATNGTSGGKFPVLMDSSNDIGKNGVVEKLSRTGFQGIGFTTSQSKNKTGNDKLYIL